MLQKAYRIACNDLRACYGAEGIYAGLHHFKDYWARDSFFASLGCLAIKDTDIVRKNLSLFLKSMRPDGQLPLRVGKSTLGVAASYAGFPIEGRKPIYSIDKNKAFPVDQNSLVIISAHAYIRAAKDRDFLKKIIPLLEKAESWNSNQLKKGLIWETGYSNWADSIKKEGHVLYTNVCYCHSLRCLAELSGMISPKKSHIYLEKFESVRKKINHDFWTGEHYLDWINDSSQNNYFSTDGNMLAILWGIADHDKSIKIEEAAHVYELHEVPSGCVHPPYPSRLISGQLKAIGLSDYHNGLSWIWLGCISAIARQKLGQHKEAIDLIERIASLIIKHGKVYEVYTKEGNPVERLIYKAEKPFAWSAGMFIYACSLILDAPDHKQDH
jgi:glycogen debranching enzyme